MNAKQLEAEIAARTARLAPQLAEMEALKRFDFATEFVRWLKFTTRTELWAEWNGGIYASGGLVAGRMSQEPPIGRAEHAPGWPSEARSS